MKIDEPRCYEFGNAKYGYISYFPDHDELLVESNVSWFLNAAKNLKTKMNPSIGKEDFVQKAMETISEELLN
jgi:hypothetical protein